MNDIRIGNWIIDNQTIKWVGSTKIYLIERNLLLQQGQGSRARKYDWLLHVVEKDFIKEQDRYSLNTAFVLAAYKWGLIIDGTILTETLAEQQNL